VDPPAVNLRLDEGERTVASELTTDTASNVQQGANSASRLAMSERGQAVVELSMRQNIICQVAMDPSAKPTASAVRTYVALEVSKRYLEVAPRMYADECGRRSFAKAVLLAPTVPLLREHVAVARSCIEDTGLRVAEIIGGSVVDSWRKEEWEEAIQDYEMLMLTPQTFLEALEEQYLKLAMFAVVIMDECHHCTGKHPFKRFLKTHNSQESAPSLRVLGLTDRSVKRKVKNATERQKAIERLERSMFAKAVYLP